MCVDVRDAQTQESAIAVSGRAARRSRYASTAHHTRVATAIPSSRPGDHIAEPVRVEVGPAPHHEHHPRHADHPHVPAPEHEPQDDHHRGRDRGVAGRERTSPAARRASRPGVRGRRCRTSVRRSRPPRITAIAKVAAAHRPFRHQRRRAMMMPITNIPMVPPIDADDRGDRDPGVGLRGDHEIVPPHVDRERLLLGEHQHEPQDDERDGRRDSDDERDRAARVGLANVRRRPGCGGRRRCGLGVAHRGPIANTGADMTRCSDQFIERSSQRAPERDMGLTAGPISAVARCVTRRRARSP